MNRSVLRILPLAFVLVTAAAAAHEPSHHAAPVAAPATDPALAAVYTVVDRFSAALKAADFDTVRDLLADDVVILEMGGAERSREEYLGHHAIGDASFLGGATVVQRQRSGRVDGNTAWVATESDITPNAGSDAKPMLSTETMVLQRTGKDWRIVHIHWSSRTRKVTP